MAEDLHLATRLNGAAHDPLGGKHVAARVHECKFDEVGANNPGGDDASMAMMGLDTVANADVAASLDLTSRHAALDLDVTARLDVITRVDVARNTDAPNEVDVACRRSDVPADVIDGRYADQIADQCGVAGCRG